MQPHIVPPSTYLKVAAWLAVLLVATVWVAEFELGVWNTPAAMAIAIAKAVLIVLFFMHVRYASPLVQVFAASGFLWLIILFVFALSDVLTRPPPREMAPQPPELSASPEAPSIDRPTISIEGLAVPGLNRYFLLAHARDEGDPFVD